MRDGGGTRYLLGPLYLLLGDTAGALRSFAWFAQTFPDDSGDPVHFLCWTLALYRSGDLKHATVTLRQTMLSNSDDVPAEVLALWEPLARHWAHTVYVRASMQRVRRRYIAIYHQLQTEPLGPTRHRLVDEAMHLKYPPRTRAGWA